MLTVPDYREAVKRWRGRNALRNAAARRWPATFGPPVPPVRCPHCDADLSGLLAEPVVVASRRCVGCGRRVVHDPEPPAAGEMPEELPYEPEYRAAVRQHTTGTTAAGLMLVGGWMFSCCASGAVSHRLPNVPTLHVAYAVWAVGGPPGVAMTLLWVLNKRSDRDPNVKCWGCREKMLLWPDVVALTGNCVLCGAEAVERAEPDPVPDAGPPLPRDVFAARMQARSRATEWATRVGFVAAAMWTAACAVSAAAAWEGDPVLRAEWRMDDRAATRPALWCGLGWSVALALGLSAYLWRTERRTNRAYPLACPHCRKRFPTPGDVLATRRCGRCKRVAVVDDKDDGGPSQAGLPTR